jgi:hypothetical protein
MSGQSTLKPHDVVVACQIAIWPEETWTYKKVGASLRISTSEIFNVIKRCRHAKLVTPRSASKTESCSQVNKAHLLDFLIHGVPTAFYPKRGEVVRGVLTAVHAPLFRSRFTSDRDIPIVWPFAKGKDMGEGLLPLYPTVPAICQQEGTLYNMLSAIDVLRVGKQREKDAAVAALASILRLDLPA